MDQLVICPMEPADLEICTAIEQHAPDPWTGPQLAEELAFEPARLFVARLEGRPVALAAFQLAAGEASLNTVTVDPAFRRRGIAAALLAQALASLAAEGAETCFLEVRAQNVPALALYEHLGFEKAGLRRGFYKNPPDDAVVMTKNL